MLDPQAISVCSNEFDTWVHMNSTGVHFSFLKKMEGNLHAIMMKD